MGDWNPGKGENPKVWPSSCKKYAKLPFLNHWQTYLARIIARDFAPNPSEKDMKSQQNGHPASPSSPTIFGVFIKPPNEPISKVWPQGKLCVYHSLDIYPFGCYILTLHIMDFPPNFMLEKINTFSGLIGLKKTLPLLMLAAIQPIRGSHVFFQAWVAVVGMSVHHHFMPRLNRRHGKVVFHISLTKKNNFKKKSWKMKPQQILCFCQVEWCLETPQKGEKKEHLRACKI